MSAKLVRLRPWRPLPPFPAATSARLCRLTADKSFGFPSPITPQFAIASLSKQICRGLRQIYGPKRPGFKVTEPTRITGQANRSQSLVALPSSFKPFSFAHNFLVQGILKRITNTQAANLRRKTAKSFFSGHGAPFLSLVGVSLASGTGLITKEDEVECVCSEIRQAATRVRTNLDSDPITTSKTENKREWTLKDFHFGDVLAKGCNAVVYAAKVATDSWRTVSDAFEHIEGVAEPEVKKEEEIDEIKGEFPLAVKMMFNYEAESNSYAILRAMHRETLPVRNVAKDELESEDFISEAQNLLPAHPNIVEMYTYFTDQVPDIRNAKALYPAALPKRIHPEGFGRNMSLFLVMKKYDMSLSDFLKQHEVSWKTSLIILTQILEGVTHLVSHNIAHRDLKSDNILMDLSAGIESPAVVITDFGCCLSNAKNDLRLPFPSRDVDLGGNAALMAPEVYSATPGLFTFINFSKADVWAVGAVAFEIFGLKNPFYESNKKLGRKREAINLPPFPENVPREVQNLVSGMLEMRPKDRLSA